MNPVNRSDAGSLPVRILLVGLDESLTRAVARYVSTDDRVTLVGAAPSLALARMLIPGLQPDLAVLDWRMLGVTSPDALKNLRADQAALCVVCVTEASDAYTAAAHAAGADATLAMEEFETQFEALLVRSLLQSADVRRTAS